MLFLVTMQDSVANREEGDKIAVLNKNRTVDL